ncbi:hypothetical protein M441DRAFT_62954 [Trichoderma asperellum CBS 433.97]|uniref:Uncharacterized protein n=1 Tax=Trichoderma asperellum (strain ATCC 204424 / CBS 433.97 / NBRC 101777) TaxID=1042311 RepID=A0A2T3YRN5_TRIA4|nr:hypothetical protein M441DRAFT_62954 [Trichoderma asperellum CBS 433.97]PTB35222.1 hypothetical protein M441DRAFT_62954 [Trichoderma asperellum CBS 433.97]
MPNCVSKPVFWKIRERLSLAATIEELGFLVMACSFCKCHGMGDRCKMMDGVMRCKECMRRGRSCDGTGVLLSALNCITSEHKRLRLEEKEAAEQLAEYQQKAAEALSRLSRIRSQCESLVT